MPGLPYLDLDLSVNAAAGGYHVSLYSPEGEAGCNFAAAALPAAAVDLCAAPAGAAAVEDCGRQLFDCLFQDEVAALFAANIAHAQDRKLGLRIRLRLAAAPELAVLPWEILYSPAQDRFLVTSNQTTLVHYLEFRGPVDAPEATLPLNVLVVTATPAELEQLDTGQEWTALRRTLAPLAKRNLLSLHRLHRPTRNCLQEELAGSTAYHILHFIGHGVFDTARSEGFLCLCDAEGRLEMVSATVFAMLLRDHTTLRLAVLNTCEGAVVAAADTFCGVAQTLVRQGLPAAIAMQSPITDDAAICFSHAFYRALAGGGPVDAALAEARKTLFGSFAAPLWAAPRLVTHARDLTLWHFAPGEGDGEMESVHKGLTALGQLMQTPAVRTQVATFRTQLEQALETFLLLSRYKEIHDRLHQIETYCYTPILGWLDLFPDNENARVAVYDHYMELKEQVRGLRAIAAEPGLLPGEIDWIAGLEEVEMELGKANETQDPGGLRRAARRLGSILATKPPLINRQLLASAHELSRVSISSTLRSIVEGLRPLKVGDAAFDDFEHGVAALESLRERLLTEVEEHGQWQNLDVELRRIHSQLMVDLQELLDFWGEIKRITAPLLGGAAEEWAVDLANSSKAVDDAITTDNPARIRQQFRNFRRIAAQRFYRVDIDLKTLCGEVAKIAGPLNLLITSMGGEA